MQIEKRNENKLLIYFVLMLSIIIHISSNSITNKIKKNLIEEKWRKNDNCYAYLSTKTLNPNNYIGRIGYGEIGFNKNNKKTVFVEMSQHLRKPKNIQNLKLPENYIFNSQSVVGTYKHLFPIQQYSWLINETKNWYFVWISTFCKYARNEEEPTPSGFKEIVDNDISDSHKHTCNYRCRTIYTEEKGRCSFLNNLWTCSYITNLY